MGFLGKFVRGAWHTAGRVAKAGGKIAGGAIEITADVAGSVVGTVSDRLGESIKEGGKFAARVVEAPGMIADQILCQTGNVLSLAVDSVENVTQAADDDRDRICEHFSDLIDSGTSMRKTYTGEKIYEKAVADYNALCALAKSEEEQLKPRFEEVGNEINKNIDEIYRLRCECDREFRRFEELANHFACWQVKNETFKEETCRPCGIPIEASSYEEIFRNIDFKNSPVWTNLEAFLTGGYSTAKKAEEARDNVNKQAGIIKDKIGKSKGELVRWEQTNAAIAEIAHAYEKFLLFYLDLLCELKYATLMLKQVYLTRDICFFGDPSALDSEKLNPYFLPERHLLCLMAADKMTRILHAFGKQNYLEKDKVAILEADKKSFDDGKKEIEELQQAMAA